MASFRGSARCAVLGMALCVRVAWAEADAVALPQVVAEGEALAEPADAPSVRDPTSARTVIAADAYRGLASDTGGLLTRAPGAMVAQRGGFGQSQTLSIRGASSNGVAVLLDGIPLQGAGGAVDISTIPLGVVERLEVLRGGASARLGGGGLGGVVNVVTHRADSGPRWLVELSHGGAQVFVGRLLARGAAGGGQLLALAHGGTSRGDFSYRFDPLPTAPDNPLEPGRRANNDARQSGLLLRFARRLGGTSRAEGLAELFGEARGLAGTIEAPTPTARQETLRALGQARVAHQSDGAELAGRVYGRVERLRLGGGFFGEPFSQQLQAAGGELTASALAFARHRPSASVLVESEALRSPGGAPSRAHFAAMASDELLLFDGVATVLGSLRFDRTGALNGLSPKLGLTLLPAAWLELRANVGQTHRAPSFLELYVTQGFLLANPALRPERALSADFGATFTHARGALTATIFHALYEDLISYEYYPPMLAKPFNFAAARASGLELELAVRVAQSVDAQLGYGLCLTGNLRDDPRYFGKALPYRPRHKGVARLTAGPQVARLHAELQAQSSQAVNRTQSLFLPARAVVAAGLTGRLPGEPQVTAVLDVRNIFDTQAQDLTGYPLEGRSVFFTVAVALGGQEEER